MLRSSRPQGGGWRGTMPFVVLFTLLACLTLLVPSAMDMARAQVSPPDPTNLVIKVDTDGAVHRVNEPVHITITIANVGDQPQILQFNSGCMVNYGIDGAAFNWLDRAACAAVMTQLNLPPGTRHVFPAFIHTPRDHFLTPGPHEVWAEVLGYGRAAAQIMVTQGDDEPPPSPLMLMADVEPSIVELGGTVQFGVTVVNLTRQVQEFQTPDACPVRLTVDGWWRPALNCPQVSQTYTLQPGERLRVADRSLVFDTSVLLNRNDAVGPHSAELSFGTAGVTAVRFMVVAEGGNGGDAAIEGSVWFEDGSPAAGTLLFAMDFEAPNDTIPPPPVDSTRGPDNGGTTPPWPGGKIHGPAVTERDGRYRLTGLPAGDYIVWAQSADGSVTWFDGVRSRELATPVGVFPGQVTGGIDFRLLPFVPPPPRFPGVIEGTIMNWIPEGSRQPQHPIAGAVVVALMESAIAIEDSVPPGGDGGGEGDTGGDDDPTRGSAGEPPIPPDGWWVPRYYGMTDADGRYRIEVPHGTYRVVAGEVRHQYQWWPGANRIDGSRELAVIPEDPPAAAHFALKELDPARMVATVSGRILASTYLPPPGGGDPATGDSTFDGDPAGLPPEGDVRPIEGAQVVAHLLIEDPRLMSPSQIVAANTDADGRYTLNLRPNSPVIVQAYANGYVGQYYNHVSDIWNATPVDVTVETPTEGIDFDLQQHALPPEWGNLSGRVTTPDASRVDPNGDIMQQPVPRAIVRIRSAGAGFGPFEMVTRSDEQGWWFVSGLPYMPDGSIRYLVSAEAEGFVPAYHPAAHRASEATPVGPMPPYVDALVMVDISLTPQSEEGPYFIAGHVRGERRAPPQGDDSMGRDFPDGTSGDALPPDPEGVVPLLGAFVYVVRLDPADQHQVVAGAVACDNGTYLLTGLHEGSYLVYADRPGFRSAWFGGAAPRDAAVIQLGPASQSALLDFTLEPFEGSEPPREDNGADGDGEAGLAVPMTDLRNAPNPSRPQTTIMYRLRTMAEVTVRIYDINGRLVRTLFDRSLQNAGEQRVAWDGKDELGETIGAGMYFYRVETARQSATGKMVVVR